MVKKKSFKYISLIILAIIIIVIIIINVRKTEIYAADPVIDNLTYKYTDSSKTLAITGSGTVTKNWQSHDTLSSYKGIVETVKIGNKVTGIEESAFEGCTALKTVTFNATAICTKIGNNAFKGCTALTNIKNGTTANTMPGSITEIGESVFANCTSLQTITINNSPKIGTDVFSNCSPTLVVKITSAKATTYPISQDGIYKIEAHGGKGGDVSVTYGDDKRTGTGAKGGKSIGYIQLSKNDELKTEIYAGGSETSKSQNSVTTKGGAGGKGIGIKLGESTEPLIAAGGGGGPGGVRVCPNNSEFHGSFVAKTTHEAGKNWSDKTGMNAVGYEYSLTEDKCGSR